MSFGLALVSRSGLELEPEEQSRHWMQRTSQTRLRRMPIAKQSPKLRWPTIACDGCCFSKPAHSICCSSCQFLIPAYREKWLSAVLYIAQSNADLIAKAGAELLVKAFRH